jgi:hypothetical protein
LARDDVCPEEVHVNPPRDDIASANANALADAHASANARAIASASAAANARASANGRPPRRVTSKANSRAAASADARADASGSANANAAARATANGNALGDAIANASGDARGSASADGTADANATGTADASANANAHADAYANAHADAYANAHADELAALRKRIQDDERLIMHYVWKDLIRRGPGLPVEVLHTAADETAAQVPSLGDPLASMEWHIEKILAVSRRKWNAARQLVGLLPVLYHAVGDTVVTHVYYDRDERGRRQLYGCETSLPSLMCRCGRNFIEEAPPLG